MAENLMYFDFEAMRTMAEGNLPAFLRLVARELESGAMEATRAVMNVGGAADDRARIAISFTVATPVVKRHTLTEQLND